MTTVAWLSRSPIPVMASTRRAWTSFSRPSSPPSPPVWAWGCRSADRSSRRTADRYRPPTIRVRARRFSSFCRRAKRDSDDAVTSRGLLQAKTPNGIFRDCADFAPIFSCGSRWRDPPPHQGLRARPTALNPGTLRDIEQQREERRTRAEQLSAAALPAWGDGVNDKPDDNESAARGDGPAGGLFCRRNPQGPGLAHRRRRGSAGGRSGND